MPPAPWNPVDVDAWSLRWVLLHLIEETARHAGHADIVREAIDGATAFELLAAVEGWPATDWLKPWAPEPSQRIVDRLSGEVAGRVGPPVGQLEAGGGQLGLDAARGGTWR